MLYYKQPACLMHTSNLHRETPLRHNGYAYWHTPGFAGRTKVPALRLRPQHVQLQPVM
jgi:hypothetical protein